MMTSASAASLASVREELEQAGVDPTMRPEDTPPNTPDPPSPAPEPEANGEAEEEVSLAVAASQDHKASHLQVTLSPSSDGSALTRAVIRHEKEVVHTTVTTHQPEPLVTFPTAPTSQSRRNLWPSKDDCVECAALAVLEAIVEAIEVETEEQEVVSLSFKHSSSLSLLSGVRHPRKQRDVLV